VIIFSAAATESSNVRFAESRRRLNVAFTKARKKLIVLANAKAPWAGLMKQYIENARSTDTHFSWARASFP